MEPNFQTSAAENTTETTTPEKKNKTQFNWKEFIKALAVIAVPVALQNLLTTTGSMVDTMMIAPLGENTVGAIGLCAQFTSLMFSCYWGFVGGGMLFFAQYWGAKDDRGINRAYGATTAFMMSVSAVFCVLAVAAPELVMSIYTDKPVIKEIGVQYLRIVGFAYPLQVFSMSMSALLRSTEKVKIPLYGGILSVLTNVFFNMVLINGMFGLPALGVRGAALATVIAAVVNCVSVLLLARGVKYKYIFAFGEHFRWTKKWLGEYLRKCFPIICNELLVGIGFMVQNIVLGRQTEESIAALAVFRTLEGLVIAFFAGFSNAASVLVGKCVGSGELETAYQRAKRLVLLCGLVILAVCLFIFALHAPILHIMGLSGDSFEICTGMLAIYIVAATIRMCNWAMNDTYRSAGDAAFGTIMEIAFMYALVLPAVLSTGLIWDFPILAVFACIYIDEPIRLVIMQIHMYSGRWIKPVTPQGQAALEGFRKMHGIKGKKGKNTSSDVHNITETEV